MLFKRFVSIGLILCVLLAVWPVSAQTSTSPLLDILARVPDTARNRDFVSYIDYHALFASRPGGVVPASTAEWNALLDSDSKAARLTMAALFGISAGPEQWARILRMQDATIESTGIDFFSITRAIQVGAPPGVVVILNGNFDPAAIVKAFTAKGFKEDKLDGFTVVCNPDGCAEGQRFNVRERDLANPFGGQLGRKEPLVVTADYLYNSPDYESVQAVVQAVQDKTPSLADAPEFRAMANALAPHGTLIQAQIPDTRYVLRQTPVGLSEAAQKPFPDYSLIGFAHTHDDKAQYVVIPIVFDKAEDAEKAAAILPERAAGYTSTTWNQPFMKLAEERGGTLQEPTIYQDAETGKTVLLLVFEAALDGEEPGMTEGSFRASGILFQLFIASIAQRDMPWLAASFE